MTDLTYTTMYRLFTYSDLPYLKLVATEGIVAYVDGTAYLFDSDECAGPLEIGEEVFSTKEEALVVAKEKLSEIRKKLSDRLEQLTVVMEKTFD